jgi:D-alanyl-lipoteichoic acid acyltransferase DltB (MBOAT superfamily)
MPLGISFYVLQQISYLVDVYSGKSIAHKNFAQYALYISFFPKLLIGPIERFDHLMPQLLNPQPFVYQNFIDNLVRIVWALFKKMVIADRLAVVANSVFTSPRDFYSPQLLIGVLAFTFQIYIDFSAYSEIALATAGILGVELTNNFDRPYFSRSLTEFWRKWHISLSTWLRDYVFLPLNFKYRRKNPRELWTAIGIIITFLISGIWHGAGWTFIVWGLMHGLYQAIELLTQKWRNHNPNSGKSEVKNYARHLLEIVCTFSFVSFSWIFFKANSVKDALSIIFSILTLEGTTAKNAWIFSNGALGLDSPDFSLLLVTLIFLVLIEIAQTRVKLLPLLNTQPTWFRWIIYIVLIFSITIFGFYGENIPQDFVYFKF